MNLNELQFQALAKIQGCVGRQDVDRSIATRELVEQHPAIVDSLLEAGALEYRVGGLKVSSRITLQTAKLYMTNAGRKAYKSAKAARTSRAVTAMAARP